MNISFSPGWLWSIPVVLVLLSWLWDRLTKIGKPHRFPWRLGVGIVLGVFSSWDLLFFSLPPTQGRVLDLHTGKAIPHAKVQRSLYRQRPFTLEQYPVAFVQGSFFETSTDAEGNFNFPGWISVWPRGLAGLCGMDWLVYVRDYMPAYGCWAEPFGRRSPGCAGLTAPQSPDPWTHFVGSFTRMHAGIEVATARNDSLDSWAEAFRRMNFLLQDKRIQIEEFVEVAVVLGQKTAMTDEVAAELYRAAFELGHIQSDGSYYKAREGLTLILLVEGYCDTNRDSKFCSKYRHSIDFRKDYFVKAVGPR